MRKQKTDRQDAQLLVRLMVEDRFPRAESWRRVLNGEHLDGLVRAEYRCRNGQDKNHGKFLGSHYPSHSFGDLDSTVPFNAPREVIERRSATTDTPLSKCNSNATLAEWAVIV